MNVAALGTTVRARRVGNLYYTRCFANVFLREMALAKGRLQEALTRLQLHFCTQGSEMTKLLPQHGRVMWKVVQDIFNLDPVRELMSGFFSQLYADEEFETLPIDGTVKVCLGIMGQNENRWRHPQGRGRRRHGGKGPVASPDLHPRPHWVRPRFAFGQ